MTMSARSKRGASAALASLLLLAGSLGCDEARDAITDDPDGAGAAFRVLIENTSTPKRFSDSGVFTTPSGADGPGPLAAGAAYEFAFAGAPGSSVSFASMFVQSNDLFYAPGEQGIALYDAAGTPVVGDVTDQISLWDAGVEVNEEPGVGENQAPRQPGPDTGPNEGGVVMPVDDGFTYPSVSGAISVSLSSMAPGEFMARIENVSDGSVLLAPGVYVVHHESAPLFTSGGADRGEGLEALAEDGSPGDLGAAVAEDTGVPVIIAPGVWVLHAEPGGLFTEGSPDLGQGLEALAEDGDPSRLAASLAGDMALHGGAFTTPVGAAGPAPVGPGGAYEFLVAGAPGARLSFATMFVQSNDLFYATPAEGLELFSFDGTPLSGDITDSVLLWDAGTETNEAPGVGPNQAPRQPGPNSGATEGGAVRVVDDGYAYPLVADSIRVTIHVE
jgi:hypothetical protein